MAEPAATPENETTADAAATAAPARKLTLPLIIAAGLIVGGAAGALVLGPRIARARAAGKDAKATAKQTDSFGRRRTWRRNR